MGFFSSQPTSEENPCRQLSGAWRGRLSDVVFACLLIPHVPPAVLLCYFVRVWQPTPVQDQFISSSEGTTTTTAPTQATATHASDSAPYSDQYSAYSGYPEPNAKPSVAHV